MPGKNPESYSGRVLDYGGEFVYEAAAAHYKPESHPEVRQALEALNDIALRDKATLTSSL